MLRKTSTHGCSVLCGRNVVFGQNVVLRHPHKIHIGRDVVIDDNCLLDAKGETNRGIRIGDGVHRPQHHPVVQERRHRGRRRLQHRIQLRAVFRQPRDDRALGADSRLRLRHRRRS
jgi:acetyltransferase-like isoleucine patch superfamily enzyme